MRYFNPRVPLGPRRLRRLSQAYCHNISIHAVLWDRDPLASNRTRLPTHFNPRGPLGPRRIRRFITNWLSKISIHAVLWDRDTVSHILSASRADFNPRGPLGPRPPDRDGGRGGEIFQSTRSSGTATRNIGRF